MLEGGVEMGQRAEVCSSTVVPDPLEQRRLEDREGDDVVVTLRGPGPRRIVVDPQIAPKPDQSGTHGGGTEGPPVLEAVAGLRRRPGIGPRRTVSDGTASRVIRMPYEVHTPVFDGPFDLLLHLILREQVDLYEINLSEIVDAYLHELERMERLDLEVATEFLLIAATLVELKARRLLPDDREVDIDDEFGLWEERDLLLARLIECKTFKDAALILRGLSAAAARSYPRRCGPVEDHFLALAPDLLENTSPEDLRDAFRRASAPKPVVRVDISHMTPIKVTVAEAVEELLDELPRAGRMTFRDLTAALVDRIDVVVRFLAVLELFKQGVVELEQSSTFGDISVVWTGGDDVRPEEILIDAYEG